MNFDDRIYTREAIIKQLGLIELHCKDGSAIDAGCQCIDTKHLYLIEGLAEEGQGFALSEAERKFYANLADFVRSTRKNMEVETWRLPGSRHSNPGHSRRRYLPHNLTECEKTHPDVRKKLSSCIKKVEEREGCTSPYIGCPVNPVAVCRTSVSCP